MLALIRVQAKYRPVSGLFQGMRLQSAIPNMAARKMVKTSAGFKATNTPVPAFRKPYLIEETGDQDGFSEADLGRFKLRLKWLGYDEFQFLTDLNGRKHEELPPVVSEKIAKFQQMIDAAGAQAGRLVG